ncbi:hypothetical protein M1O53_01180, partial [Dehalococcoidia bacterium]|nr:hypothetical protein [Dehalococcoidia bacterium]
TDEVVRLEAKEPLDKVIPVRLLADKCVNLVTPSRAPAASRIQVYAAKTSLSRPGGCPIRGSNAIGEASRIGCNHHP